MEFEIPPVFAVLERLPVFRTSLVHLYMDFNNLIALSRMVYKEIGSDSTTIGI